MTHSQFGFIGAVLFTLAGSGAYSGGGLVQISVDVGVNRSALGAPVVRTDDNDGTKVLMYSQVGIDTVLFPAKSLTGPSVCVSVQIGCVLGKGGQAKTCLFCSTGKFNDFKGNLDAYAIAEQALNALRGHSTLSGQDRVRVVFAGMGDSSYNPEGVVGAMSIIQKELPDHAVDFVIATVGIPIAQFELLQNKVLDALRGGQLKQGTQIYPQISLHASTTEKRGFLIQAAKGIEIDDVLISALKFRDQLEPLISPVLRDKTYPDGLLITLNYVLMGPRKSADPSKKGFEGNHTDEDLEALVELLKRRGKDKFIVRLSAYNPDKRDGDFTFSTVGDSDFDRWETRLLAEGIVTRIFTSEGRRVRGGCGQLMGPGAPEVQPAK